MRKRVVFVSVFCLIGLALVGACIILSFNISALPEPGKFETSVANKAKNVLVRRETRRAKPKELPVTAAASDNAQNIFGSECASCHGDGRTPSDIGRGMYPRTPDLGGAEVQHWSDPELFWIIHNGIRLTGMPAFGKQLSDEETWSLVHYVRSLPAKEKQ